MKSIISNSQFSIKARLTYLVLLWQLICRGQFFKGGIKTKHWFVDAIVVEYFKSLLNNDTERTVNLKISAI